MKINEVENLVGITKKNIRFYEEQGLLVPRRNSENRYRDYSDEDVQELKRIKLMRKLGVSIEEIKKIQSGVLTLEDGIRRHQIALQRQQASLEQSVLLCRRLRQGGHTYRQLPADEVLEDMSAIEREGTLFVGRQTQDVRVRYVAPVLVTIIMVGLMAAMIALILWEYSVDPQNIPLSFMWVCVGLMLSIACGCVAALVQRIREIVKGEVDDAKKY